ncbi:hypothetical protein [Desulfosporosinus sp. BG]|uniref:hypothetical protein n=1 Tax=Desulfosporosinus sp. BG TaxID=1633135 RepID=UPI000856CDD1|nr:hypothetical protein [Desulfosporosinus sp. BG]ODA42996.1 hypothetical protein DSBG_0346 [Desulfosporosinus sp. BG]
MKRILWTLLLLPFLITAGCSTKSTTNPPTNPPQPSTQTSTQSSQLPPTKTQSTDVTTSTMSFRWIALKDDILNPKALTKDGKPDGHFHVLLPFTETTKIKYMIMRYTEFGAHVQWAWDYNPTVAIVGSPMAVFVNGEMVTQGTDIGLPSSGNTDLDLYVSELNNENGWDTFKFENGQTISIQIKYITKSGAEKEFDATTGVNM